MSHRIVVVRPGDRITIRVEGKAEIVRAMRVMRAITGNGHVPRQKRTRKARRK